MPLRRLLPLALACFIFLAPPRVAAQELVGFTGERSEWQQSCEVQLQALPSSEAFRAHHERLTREPHPTGSAANEHVAAYLAEVMREAGWEVENYPYDVYLPTLDFETEVSIVTPDPRRLNNQEYVLQEDRFSGHPELLPGWNAFSGSGDVTREVVYANYGRKEDFERLEELGISVEDKIVIARYGGNFRGYKAKYAEARGAAGLIMYSDPADGGYQSGLPYPEGRWLSESTIQRGSVLTLGRWGDPLTPFQPALPVDHPDTPERLDPSEVDGLHTIPVTPLPYASAREILERMQGESAPQGWQGGLPFRYRLTGGPALTVRLRVDQPKDLVRATNVIGTLEGSEHPDEWILLGAHFDAWAYGAVDPNSGTAMLLTLVEALGELAQDGCAPRRTIKIGHWDAEEYGIIGSSEWVMHLGEELSEKAVAYINADAVVSGPNFGASAAPSLKQPILDAAKAVTYPGSEETIYERWKGERDEAPMGNLGGGSDHVGFYMYLGIPSAGMSMSGPSPIYHSNYDNFAWYERFGDSEFVFGPALARVDGVLALRLANADLLPLDVQRYATDLEIHVDALEERAGETMEEAAPMDRLRAAVEALGEAAEAFDEARQQFVGAEAPAAARDEANRQLIALERAWLHEDGLQPSAWNRSLYASPDPFSGYASWMLPGLRYEIETGTAESLAQWEGIYAGAVEALTRRVEALTGTLRR